MIQKVNGSVSRKKMPGNNEALGFEGKRRLS
jgi:hypothetical protein